MEYSEKYNPNGIGLRTVYDHIYLKEVSEYRIQSNMVAVSGESIDVYVKSYIPKVITTVGKAIIMELNYSRLRRLKANIKKISSKLHNKIKIVGGNVVTYVDNPMVKRFVKTPVRFLDLGLGIGMKDLSEIARLMLHGQQKVAKHRMKKVIILDGSRRKKTDLQCMKYLNNFLAPIKQEITHVNGVSINSKRYLFHNGLELGKLSEGHPMQHTVTLKGDVNRKAMVTMYTYTNGNAMLTTVLKYK